MRVMHRRPLVFACFVWIACGGCPSESPPESDSNDDDATGDESNVCFPLETSLPSEIVIEYLARAPDGTLLVVVRPDADSLVYEDFRLFYGPEEKLKERTIRTVARARDGGSTHLFFDVLGEEADAFFPIHVVDAMFAPGPATLELGGETLALERLEPDAALLDDAMFECLD